MDGEGLGGGNSIFFQIVCRILGLFLIRYTFLEFNYEILVIRVVRVKISYSPYDFSGKFDDNVCKLQF